MMYLVLSSLYYILLGYWYVMTFSIILSWIPGIQNTKICRIIRYIGDLFLYPFEGKLVFGIIDFTPVIGLSIYRGILTLLIMIL